jgi:uroporphyrinogen-III synthase
MAKTSVALKKKSIKKAIVPTKKKEVALSKPQPKQKTKSKVSTADAVKVPSSKAKKAAISPPKATKKAAATISKSKKLPSKKAAVIKSSPKKKQELIKTKAGSKPISLAAESKKAKKATPKPIARITKKVVKSEKLAPIVKKVVKSEKKAPTAKKAVKSEKIAPIEKKAIKKAPIELPIAELPKQTPDKKPRIKNVLISQAYPENGKSPFIDIGNKWKLKVDFRSFIQVEGLTAKEFRRLRINVPDYTAIIFNSRNAIHYFFKLCEEMRVKLSPDMKYFCTSEAIALYLQKYIHYRKRKVFYEYANKTLFEILNKHKDNEKFLYPCSKDRKDDIPNFLATKKFNYSEAFIYQTVPSDLSDLKSIKYDVIIFFSPVGIKSLMHNYPDFIQEDRRIGAFGPVTHDAVRATFRLDIVAPSPVAHSMAQALENYLKESNGKP